VVKGKSAKWYAARACASAAAKAQRERNAIRYCGTCKHGFWAGIADLRCTDPRKGCENAKSYGANALLCDNYETRGE
jgi:hypothetical protein